MESEYIAAYELHSPLIDRLLAHGYRKSVDLEHYVERIGSFFVIILGEGVILLVRGSPLGQGVNSQVGTGIAALALYFCLHMFYFRGSHTSHSIASVRRATWKLALWQICHILLFNALQILDMVNLFVVQTVSATADEHPEESMEPRPSLEVRRLLPRAPSGIESTAGAELSRLMNVALWTGSAAASCVVFSLGCLHRLNRSALQSKGHIIDNVFVRLSPRFALVVVLPCLPLIPHLSGAVWMALVVGLVYLVTVWELLSGFRREGAFFEPKSG